MTGTVTPTWHQPMTTDELHTFGEHLHQLDNFDDVPTVDWLREQTGYVLHHYGITVEFTLSSRRTRLRRPLRMLPLCARQLIRHALAPRHERDLRQTLIMHSLFWNDARAPIHVRRTDPDYGDLPPRPMTRREFHTYLDGISTGANQHRCVEQQRRTTPTNNSDTHYEETP